MLQVFIILILPCRSFARLFRAPDGGNQFHKYFRVFFHLLENCCEDEVSKVDFQRHE